MSDREPLTYLLTLDGLNSEMATYQGPNGAMAQVDRAAFDSNGRPTEVKVVIGRVEETGIDHV